MAPAQSTGNLLETKEKGENEVQKFEGVKA